MKFLKNSLKSKGKILLPILLAFVLATAGIIAGVQVQDVTLDDVLTIGQGQKVLTIGTEAYAVGTADYTCDGVADNIQFQAALDALPATGGKIIALTGNYVFAATVTRAIDDVIIEGNGLGTSFTNDGITAIFSAGLQANWVFRDFATDAGGLTTAAASEVTIQNVDIGGTHWAFDTSLDIGGASWDIPVGRGATLVVAASDAYPNSIAQADYICDGVADDVQIQAANDALPAQGGIIQLTEGTYNLNATLLLDDGTSLYGRGIGVTNLEGGGGVFRSIANRNFAGGANNNIVVERFTLDGNSSINTPMVFNGVTELFVKNVEVHHGDQFNIEVGNSLNVWISDSIFHNSQTDDCVSITDGGAASVSRYIHITNCQAHHCGNNDNGFEVDDGPKHVYFNNCGVYDNTTGTGFYVHTHGGEVEPQYIYYDHCWTYNCLSFGYIIDCSEIGYSACYADGADLANCNGLAFGTNISQIDVQLRGTRLNGPVVHGYNEPHDVKIDVVATDCLRPAAIDYAVTIRGTSAVSLASNIYINAQVDGYGGSVYAKWVENMTITGALHSENNPFAAMYGINFDTYVYDTLVSVNMRDNPWGINIAANCDYIVITDCDLRGCNPAITNASNPNGSIHNNLGIYVTENQGMATLLNGNTSVVVAHGLSATPTIITITFAENPTNLMADWWVDTVGAANFTFNGVDPGASNLDFYWYAAVR